MFYKLNKLTQSIISATQDVAMGRRVTPQACSPTVAEASNIHYEYRTVEAPEARQIHIPAEQGRYPVPNNSSYRKLMDMQSLFVAQDGKLVWQKLPKDRTLYLIAVIGTVLASLSSVWSLYILASPPKNQ